jgi:putative nucleotidyltransferase with HDIG domain
VDPQQAYLAGLLHDIGRFVMFEHDPVDLEAVDCTHWETPEELLAAERALCGFDHTELGAQACRVWKVPSEVTDVIQFHHVRTVDSARPGAPMIRVIQQADALSCLLLKSPDIVKMEPSERQDVIERKLFGQGSSAFPATPNEISSIVGPIASESADLVAALGIGSRHS